MKKILLVFSIALLSLSSFGQLAHPRSLTGKEIVSKSNFTNDPVIQHRTGAPQNEVTVMDTIWDYYDRATGLYIYNTGYGYPFGTDEWNTDTLFTVATGCHYDGIGNAIVKKVLIFFGKKKIMGGVSDTAIVSICSVNADTSVNAILGSTKLSVTAMDTTNGVNFVTVTANVTGAFMIVVDFSTFDDSIAIVSNKVGDGKGEKRARVLINPKITGVPGVWYPANDPLIYSGFDADVMMIPILDDVTGVGEFKNELFTLKSISPNPSNGLVSLQYTLAEPTTVSYSVLDMTGKVILTSASEMKAPANYNETIDMTKFAAGEYFVMFNAGAKTLTQEMIIAK